MKRLIVIAVVVASAGLTAAVAGATRIPAYCDLPSNPPSQDWAFHVGAPIRSSTGTYAHGHGAFNGTRAGGVICQVDRPRHGADRQIILAVERKPVLAWQHPTYVHGHIGNRIILPVRVTQSTDPNCKVGTQGTMNMFATYNGVHEDTVYF